MKKILAFFLILTLTSSVAALTIKPDKTFLEVGEEVTATGSCDPQITNYLEVFVGELMLLNSVLDCPGKGEFEFSYKTSFLDPVGKWTLVISNDDESTQTEITMNDKREAGFFLLRFLSPTVGKYKRTESITLSVEVTDSGQIIDDANVAFFGLNGKRLFLQNVGNGVYSLEYEIPHDAKLEVWELEVLAEATRNNSKVGGKNRLPMELESSPIIIEILEPSISSFELGNQIPLKINATYFNGKPLAGTPAIKVQSNGKELTLVKTGENIFEGTLEAPSSQSSTLELLFTAIDEGGNSGTNKKDLILGCSITCLIRNYGLFILLAIVITAAVLNFVVSKLNVNRGLNKLEEEKEKTLKLIKSLQEEYFKKGIMPSSSYKKNLSNYKSKIVELDEKIKELKRRKELE